jgi:hypothetical protein
LAPIDYASTVPFEGNTAKAFDLASAALTTIGFRIQSRDGSSLELTGPGMGSTRQSALLGASRIRIDRGAHELSITAELGGVRRMARFLILFPLGLCLFLAILFFVLFSLLLGRSGWVVPVVVATGGNALLWMVLAPLVARHLRARTCRGIDTLLNNMAVAGNAA